MDAETPRHTGWATPAWQMVGNAQCALTSRAFPTLWLTLTQRKLAPPSHHEHDAASNTTHTA